MTSSYFWDVTQRRLVVSYRRFGTSVCYHFLRSSSPSIFSVSLDLLATNLRCVTSQKNEDLIYTAPVMGPKVDIRLPLRCKWDLVLLPYYAAQIGSYRSFGTTYPPRYNRQSSPSAFWDSSTLEDGTDSLSRNVGVNYKPTLCNIAEE